MVTAQTIDSGKVEASKKAASVTPKTKVSKTSAEKPVAAKKTTVKKANLDAPALVTMAETPVKPLAVKKAALAKPKASEVLTPQVGVSVEQRATYVAVAAFYIAERRGFEQGNPMDDWLAAEAEVDRLIAAGEFAC